MRPRIARRPSRRSSCTCIRYMDDERVRQTVTDPFCPRHGDGWLFALTP